MKYRVKKAKIRSGRVFYLVQESFFGAWWRTRYKTGSEMSAIRIKNDLEEDADIVKTEIIP